MSVFYSVYQQGKDLGPWLLPCESSPLSQDTEQQCDVNKAAKQKPEQESATWEIWK